MPESDERSQAGLLADAARARRDAERHRIAASLVHDALVEETLRSRALELESLARTLAAQAEKIGASPY